MLFAQKATTALADLTLKEINLLPPAPESVLYTGSSCFCAQCGAKLTIKRVPEQRGNGPMEVYTQSYTRILAE